ncbi:TolC family protein [Leptolyngbya sp. FACHB-261]|nr:TolC family protein [Leptolyngbya sp. FACHB-261]MBD2100087.1 TolC family protein [Leptolyngbya sp. FACHB-261]
MSQAQGGLQSVRLRFQAGEDTQLDVISAEDELTQAEGDLSRAILNYN